MDNSTETPLRRRDGVADAVGAGADAGSQPPQTGPAGVVLGYDRTGLAARGNHMSRGIFSRTGVRYEVACDVIGALIAHQAEIIAAEESKPSPDRGVIADAEATQRRLRDEREGLDSHDLGAIERIIGTYGPQARAAYE